MKKIECYYYLTESGQSPVRDFVDSLDHKTQRKFFFVKSLLETFGHRLSEPHAKYLDDDIFELRFKGKEGAVRVFYFFFHESKAIFTNAFIKKSARTPLREKEVAVKRRASFINREASHEA